MYEPACVETKHEHICSVHSTKKPGVRTHSFALTLLHAVETILSGGEGKNFPLAFGFQNIKVKILKGPTQSV